MSFSSLSLDALQAFRAAIDAEIASRSPVKAEPVKAEVKAPREPGIAASWLSHVIKAHASDYASYKESSQDKRGVALIFAKQWRAQHAEEYSLFEADFKKPILAAPQAPAPSPVIPQPPLPVEKKARKPWSPETKAAAAAKRAAKKATPPQ